MWLQRARQPAGSGPLSSLRLILPKGKSAILAHRLAAIDPGVSMQIFELDELDETLDKVDPRASGNVATWLVPGRESQLPRAIRTLAATIVQQDVARVDVSLLPEQVYDQVFAHTAAQHGILDLLGSTRAGRLAILELKTTEDLPLQAADYWSRIRRHQEAGHLARYGYFPGVQLQPTPPLVYLIAPALRFHPSTDVLLEFLHPEMEVIRIGLAESWRCGLRVMMRQ